MSKFDFKLIEVKYKKTIVMDDIRSLTILLMQACIMQIFTYHLCKGSELFQTRTS